MHNQLSGALCRTERGGVCGEKRLHFGGSHHSSSFFPFFSFVFFFFFGIPRLLAPSKSVDWKSFKKS